MGSKRSHSLTSAETIAGNDDLLMETILLRLPAKPLIRFQLACKHWQSLISDSSFYRRHTHGRRPKSQHSYILHPNPAQFFYFSPICRVFHSFHFDSPYTKILQSCNGLLLLKTRYSPYGKKIYSVYNHTLNQSFEVKIKRHHTYVCGVFLAFDPSVSPHFKIICVFNPNYLVEVYDSGSKEWTRFGTPFPNDFVITKFMSVIYWNNRIYWFQRTYISFYIDLQTGNVGTAPFIETPSRKYGEVNKNYIMESNGHVHCVSISLSHKVKLLCVFELIDDDSGWIEVYRVNINSISDACPEMNSQMMNGLIGVMGFVRGDTIEESSALFHIPRKVICYKFSDGSFEVVLDLSTSYIYKETELQFTRFNSFQFAETLAPV